MDYELRRAEILLEKCRTLLRNEKIPAAEKINRLIINDRVRSRFGKCTKDKDGYTIELSRRLLDGDDKAVETVILHELLHTCPRCLNHGKRWKVYAERLNGKYGYKITSTTSYKALGLEDPGSRESVKYIVICTKCGMQIPRKRRCRLVENVDRYYCGKCGGKLEIH